MELLWIQGKQQFVYSYLIIYLFTYLFIYFEYFRFVYNLFVYAPVICIPRPLGTWDTGDIAGLKCRNLTSDVSRQCRGCAGVLISR